MAAVLAYLDPGTGAVVAQVFAAGAAGVAVVGSMGRQRLKAAFSRRQPAAADVANIDEEQFAD